MTTCRRPYRPLTPPRGPAAPGETVAPRRPAHPEVPRASSGRRAVAEVARRVGAGDLPSAIRQGMDGIWLA
ncbi:hypothetical protein, partial [Streptomyces sp. NPDC000229]|uniref:hypothetical protein n=1 Tax=Streptomyces sp. NPDC000229 TaxID=3154247 RepID=UPI0033188B39